MSTNTSMVITFSAKPEHADAFAKILERSLPLIQKEEGTIVWIAGRSDADPTTFYLVDLFASAEAQAAHFAGAAAAAILEEGSTLLAEPPTISTLSVVAAKTP